MAIGPPEFRIIVLNLAMLAALVAVVVYLVRRFVGDASEKRVEQLENRVEKLEREVEE